MTVSWQPSPSSQAAGEELQQASSRSPQCTQSAENEQLLWAHWQTMSAPMQVYPAAPTQQVCPSCPQGASGAQVPPSQSAPAYPSGLQVRPIEQVPGVEAGGNEGWQQGSRCEPQAMHRQLSTP